MAIAYPDILALKTTGVKFSWTEREAILYALGVGMAEDPLDENELKFVNERNLRVLPTFATIVANEAGPRPSGLNRALVLDGGRHLVIHRPLAGAGNVVMDGQIIDVVDKGEGKGAIIRREVVIRDKASDILIATLRSTVFARGYGGFGGPVEQREQLSSPPSGVPDRTVRIPTRPNQALFYRLSGDLNPLHIDPEFARRAGFDRPILHGLCTFGICCQAILREYGEFDPASILSFGARFSAPCFPGEVVTVDFWRRNKDLFFEARIEGRGVTVIKNGQARLG
jgi:acyl dehydratase